MAYVHHCIYTLRMPHFYWQLYSRAVRTPVKAAGHWYSATLWALEVIIRKIYTARHASAAWPSCGPLMTLCHAGPSGRESHIQCNVGSPL